jgi:hypothetical protein
MTVKDMVEKLRMSKLVEIRDHANFFICICKTDSKGITPYLENEVIEWFPFGESDFYGPNFCILINDEVEDGKT